MYPGEKVRLSKRTKRNIPFALHYLNHPEVTRFVKPGFPIPLTQDIKEEWFAGLAALDYTYTFSIEPLEDDIEGFLQEEYVMFG